MKFKFIACLFFNLIVSISSFSQGKEKVVDSLLKEFDTQDDYQKALLISDKALNIAKSINYKEGVIKSEIAKIITYFNLYNNSECLKRIENIEKDVLKSKNYTLIGLIKYLKGGVYCRLKLNSNAESEFDSALFFADKILDADTRHYRKGLVYLAMASLNDGGKGNANIDVLKYLKKAYQELSLTKNDFTGEALMTACSGLGEYYSNTNNFASAKFYLNKAITISQQKACKKGLTYSWNSMGNLYKNMQDYDNAIIYYEKSIKLSRLVGDVVQLESSYRNLSEIYDKLNNHEKQNESLKMLKAYTDSISDKDDSGMVLAVHGITKEIHSEHKKKTSYLKLYLLIGSVGCILLSYIVFMYFKKYKSEKENSEKLEKFLDEKTLFIQSLNSNKSILEKEEELKIVIRMAMTNDVLFFQTFNELFPDFKDKLMQLDPFFRTNDLKFCSYLKLNFDTKEIARYTGDSVRSVESKKYRLRKKFNISSQEDINAWLSNL